MQKDGEDVGLVVADFPGYAFEILCILAFKLAWTMGEESRWWSCDIKGLRPTFPFGKKKG